MRSALPSGRSRLRSSSWPRWWAARVVGCVCWHRLIRPFAGLEVAGLAAGVGEGAIAALRVREELPGEARGVQRQLEHTVGGLVAHDAVGRSCVEATVR